MNESIYPVPTTLFYIDENGKFVCESAETRLRRALYAEWRAAFYAARSRWMEGARFTIYADSDAEAIYLLTRAERPGDPR